MGAYASSDRLENVVSLKKIGKAHYKEFLFGKKKRGKPTIDFS